MVDTKMEKVLRMQSRPPGPHSEGWFLYRPNDTKKFCYRYGRAIQLFAGVK